MTTKRILQQPNHLADSQGTSAELTAEDHNHTKRVGNYEIGRLIGSGPSSKVRLGLALDTKEPYAIKIIDKKEGLLPPHCIEEAAKKEIAAAKLVRHKHVVNLKEVMQTKRHLYLVSELVTGGELFDRLVFNPELNNFPDPSQVIGGKAAAASKDKDGNDIVVGNDDDDDDFNEEEIDPLDPVASLFIKKRKPSSYPRFKEDAARKYFQQLVCALRFCHLNNIHHKNLKPENLLLDREGSLKIADMNLTGVKTRYHNNQHLVTELSIGSSGQNNNNNNNHSTTGGKKNEGKIEVDQFGMILNANSSTTTKSKNKPSDVLSNPDLNANGEIPVAAPTTNNDTNNTNNLGSVSLARMLEEKEQDRLRNVEKSLRSVLSSVGNLHYAAPEIILQKGYSSNVSDIWSCGAILYLMLAGHNAFDDTNPKELMKKIEKGQYFMSPNIPSDGAKDLIKKILVVEPARRISMAEIVAHPWFQINFDPIELEYGTILSPAMLLSVAATTSTGSVLPNNILSAASATGSPLPSTSLANLMMGSKMKGLLSVMKLVGSPKSGGGGGGSPRFGGGKGGLFGALNAAMSREEQERQLRLLSSAAGGDATEGADAAQAEVKKRSEYLLKGEDAFVIARKLMLASLVSSPRVEAVAARAAKEAAELERQQQLQNNNNGKGSTKVAGGGASSGGGASFSPTAALRYVLLRVHFEQVSKVMVDTVSQIMPHFEKPEVGSSELRGYAHAKHGLLTFQITLCRTVVPELTLCEIKKGRGDFFDFIEFVSAIQNTLGPGRVASQEMIIRAPPKMED